MTPVLVAVTQAVVDAIKASATDPVVREWVAGAQAELDKARRKEFFAEKPIRYEEDGDVLFA